jgi:hypothetical protein
MGGYYAHYQPPSSSYEPNHGVAIVGWDDDKITPADDPGAWLIKNSWGYWGPEGGYFWISYYDKCCGQHPEMGAISFQDVEFKPFEDIYYLDYHGWRDTIPEISEVFNAFTATDVGTLIAVGLFTAEDAVDYEVIVYDDYTSGELQNELSTSSGNIEHYGYHTVDLNIPVSFEIDDDFYIYVSLSSGGHPIDRTSDVPVLLGGDERVIVKSDADPGESYYKDGSTWKDLYNYQFSNPTWDESANFCVKALFGEWIPMVPDLECEGSLSWTDIPAGGEVTGEFIVRNIGDDYSRLDWEVKNWPDWGEWQFAHMSGYNLHPEDGDFTVEVTVTAPLEMDEEFTGQIKIRNKDDISDYETIQVTLKTPKTKNTEFNLFEKILSYFPILEQILTTNQIFNRILNI